jgi:hypothetical protein
MPEAVGPVAFEVVQEALQSAPDIIPRGSKAIAYVGHLIPAYPHRRRRTELGQITSEGDDGIRAAHQLARDLVRLASDPFEAIFPKAGDDMGWNRISRTQSRGRALEMQPAGAGEALEVMGSDYALRRAGQTDEQYPACFGHRPPLERGMALIQL